MSSHDLHSKKGSARFVWAAMALGLLAGGLSLGVQAETPEEKAAKQASKQATETAKKEAEAQKRIVEWNKKASESIVYKFDRFKNTTLIGPKDEKVRSLSEIFSSLGDLYFQPIATSEGEVKKDTFPLTSPETIEMNFWAWAEKRQSRLYSDATEMSLLADGKPLGSFPVKYSFGRDDKQIIENMTADIPFSIFKKMALAEKVEGRMGTIEFKFNDYQRILYRTFLARITPASKSK